MKKTDLLRPGSPRLEELLKLAKEINARETTIQALGKKAVEGCADYLTEVALQGQALIKVREALGHGMWLEWIKIHCPFSHDTAGRYMTVARNFARRTLPDGISMRHAIALLTDADEKEERPERELPEYLDAINRIGKLNTYFAKKSREDWPDVWRQKAREGLLPLVRDLWPDLTFQ